MIENIKIQLNLEKYKKSKLKKKKKRMKKVGIREIMMNKKLFNLTQNNLIGQRVIENLKIF